MKKMTTLFAVAALSFTFAATGCKKKAADEAPAAKTDEKGSAAAGSADMKKPDGSATPTTAPAGDMPAECADYKAAFDKMMACDKMKAGADAMKTGFDATMKAMNDATGPAKAAMGATCKAAADGLKTSMTAVGC